MDPTFNGYSFPCDEINAYIKCLIDTRKGKPPMSDLTLIASSPELLTRLRHMNEAFIRVNGDSHV